MNFIEAVRALKDGRCEGIKHPNWSQTREQVLVLDTRKAWLEWSSGDKFEGIAIPHYLADDWELVNERPQTEEVEVVRWICPICESIYDHPQNEQTFCHHPSVGKVKCLPAKITYTRPIPPKKKRREKLGRGIAVLSGEAYTTVLLHTNGKDADIFMEWQE